jgi:hypothetical protein
VYNSCSVDVSHSVASAQHVTIHGALAEWLTRCPANPSLESQAFPSGACVRITQASRGIFFGGMSGHFCHL